MKVLFIYPNAEGYGRIPLGMSILTSILVEERHQVELFDTTFILKNEHVDNVVREKAKLVLPTDISHLYDPHTPEEIDELLKRKLRQFLPDLVAVSIVEDNYLYADHLIKEVKSWKKNIPVIVGGSTPTVAPRVVIENPDIDYLIQGEGEEAFPEFCNLLEKGDSVEGVRNLWYKNKNGEINNNHLRPFIEMDNLPAQNLEIWDRRHFVKPYSGKLYRAGYFEMSRGCLNMCCYCINGTCRILLKDAGEFRREKSISKVIHEIKTLKDKYSFEMIFFCDDNFLLMSPKRLEEFKERWKSEIALPYWMNTTTHMINENKLEILKETNCCGIGLGIESGSEWVRKNILNRREDTNEKIIDIFKLIHSFGIRTTANTMIGFPGEYEEDIFETIKLAKRTKSKSCDVAYVAPYIGTPVHEVSKRLGYLDAWKKPGFKGMAKNITMRKGPVINVPQIKRERMIDIFYNFVDYVEGRLTIPEKFEKPAPGADAKAPPRGGLGKEAAEVFYSVYRSLNDYLRSD